VYEWGNGLEPTWGGGGGGEVTKQRLQFETVGYSQLCNIKSKCRHTSAQISKSAKFVRPS